MLICVRRSCGMLMYYYLSTMCYGACVYTWKIVRIVLPFTWKNWIEQRECILLFGLSDVAPLPYSLYAVHTACCWYSTGKLDLPSFASHLASNILRYIFNITAVLVRYTLGDIYAWKMRVSEWVREREKERESNRRTANNSRTYITYIFSENFQIIYIKIPYFQITNTYRYMYIVRLVLYCKLCATTYIQKHNNNTQHSYARTHINERK